MCLHGHVHQLRRPGRRLRRRGAPTGRPGPGDRVAAREGAGEMTTISPGSPEAPETTAPTGAEDGVASGSGVRAALRRVLSPIASPVVSAWTSLRHALDRPLASYYLLLAC